MCIDDWLENFYFSLVNPYKDKKHVQLMLTRLNVLGFLALHAFFSYFC